LANQVLFSVETTATTARDDRSVVEQRRTVVASTRASDGATIRQPLVMHGVHEVIIRIKIVNLASDLVAIVDEYGG
jgi:hypothetical protein